MKEYVCIEAKHHKDIGEIIGKYQKKMGWRLHTYQTAGMGVIITNFNVNHYLLFERDK